MTIDDINTIAWHDFLVWAWSQSEMREQFTAKTGIVIQHVTSPIEAAIDAATGAQESVAARFIEWATCEHWGIKDAPLAYQKAVSAKEKRK